MPPIPSYPLQRLEVHTHRGSTHYLAAWMPDPHSPPLTHRYMCTHTHTHTANPLINHLFLTPPSPCRIHTTRWATETWSWFWLVPPPPPPPRLDTAAYSTLLGWFTISLDRFGLWMVLLLTFIQGHLIKMWLESANSVLRGVFSASKTVNMKSNS